MAGREQELWEAQQPNVGQTAAPSGGARSSFPYQGALGRTRSEPVQVWMPDGTIRALSVYVSVDALADPALATLARAGTLHHVADGVELAITFVYHDRDARLMALVVPEALRHRALALRAEHMALVAADTQHGVPDYVRNAEVVIGPGGLAARIESGQPEAPLLSASLAMGDDLRALARRERELLRRERLLRAREEALQSQIRSALDFASPGSGTVDDSELEEVAESDAIDSYDEALVEAEIAGSGDGDELDFAPVDADEANDAELEGGNGDDGDEPVTPADEALEEVEDIEATEALDAEGPDEEALLEAALAVPEAFAADPDAELWLSENEGRVWLFVRHRPGQPRDAAPMELLLQLDPGAETPVALVTLVFDVDGSPEARRGAIDPSDPAQVRALAQLSEHFEVELMSIAGPNDFEYWASLNAPREGNARAVLGRLTRKDDPDPERVERARKALLRAPPPWRELSHPFQPNAALGAPQNATEAAVQLDELAAWLAPERRERLRLLWCVPDELVDEHCARCLGAALDWGLSLSGPLSARAISLAVAQDQRRLLERRIRGLCRTSLAPESAGLEEAVLRALWSEALEEAARLGVTLAEEARELARVHAGERAMVHATALSSSQSAALQPLRDKALGPSPDIAALEELLARGSHPDLVAGCRAAALLAPEQAGALFARVALRDDPAAVDALLSLLSPREASLVRVGAALALAQRRAVNAVDEIALNVAHSEAPAWRAFALSLGRYGGGSFRAVARALSAQNTAPERMALVYALLCCHGARAQLKAKARSGDASEAKLAERALSLASGCHSDETALLALEDRADLTVFCRIFDTSSGTLHD